MMSLRYQSKKLVALRLSTSINEINFVKQCTVPFNVLLCTFWDVVYLVELGIDSRVGYGNVGVAKCIHPVQRCINNFN